MVNLFGIFSSGFMKRSQVLLGRLSVAIPIAIEAIVAFGSLKKFYHKAQENGGVCKVLKNQIKTIDKRKVAVAGVVVIAGVVFVQTGGLSATLSILKQASLAGEVSKIIKRSGLWNLPLPPETKAVIYSAYSAMGLASFFSSYKQIKSERKNGLSATLHAAVGLTAFATPFVMQFGSYPVRWHHLSYGILCTLPESRSLQLFGSAMCLDSVGYWVMKNPSNFGYDNIFANNFNAITLTLAGCTVWQRLTESGFINLNPDIPVENEIEMRVMDSSDQTST